MYKLNQKFFSKDARNLAKELLGKILVRKIEGNLFKAKIVETEAYLDENDTASWARFGKRKDNNLMWSHPGKILIKNVHMHKMLNIVSGKNGKAEAVLLRALEPLNFEGRCNGPGLLTNCMKIDKKFHGEEIFNLNDFWIENDGRKYDLHESFRIGVKKDLSEKMRFYIKGNKYVSRK